MAALTWQNLAISASVLWNQIECESLKNSVYGFKAFNPDWTCRGFQYEVGNSYILEEVPVMCARGFHFCIDPSFCFRYYDWDAFKMALVRADPVTLFRPTSGKYVTNHITILKDISDVAFNEFECIADLVDSYRWVNWIHFDGAIQLYCRPFMEEDQNKLKRLEDMNPYEWAERREDG